MPWLLGRSALSRIRALFYGTVFSRRFLLLPLITGRFARVSSTVPSTVPSTISRRSPTDLLLLHPPSVPRRRAKNISKGVARKKWVNEALIAIDFK